MICSLSIFRVCQIHLYFAKSVFNIVVNKNTNALDIGIDGDRIVFSWKYSTFKYLIIRML